MATVTTGCFDRNLVGLPRHTNDPLPDIKRHEIRAMISTEQHDIRIINEELSRVPPSGTNDLQSRLRLKKCRIATLRMLISPLKDLPNEVISTIFEQHARGPHAPGRVTGAPPPWYLGQICSRWRAIALETPNLWNCIVLNFYQKTQGSQHSFDSVKELLRRTERSQIACLIYRPSHGHRPISDVFRMLSEHTSRLRCLHIHSVDSLSSLRQVSGISLPSLELLSVTFNAPENIISHALTIPIFKYLPRLHSISIFTHYASDVGIDSNILFLGVPWGQLTHLHIINYQFTSSRPVYMLLSQCPNLLECRLTAPTGENSVHETLSNVELKYLNYLGLTDGCGVREYSNFFEWLTLPSLKRLKLPWGYTRSFQLRHDLLDLVERSVCNIEAIELPRNFPHSLIHPFLEKMTSLKWLALSEEGILSIPLVILSIARYSHFQNLECIECRVSTFDAFGPAFGGLRDVLERIGSDSPILEHRPKLKIALMISEGLDKEAILQIKTLQRNWLEIFLTSAEDEVEYPPNETWNGSPVGITRGPPFSDQYW